MDMAAPYGVALANGQSPALGRVPWHLKFAGRPLLALVQLRSLQFAQRRARDSTLGPALDEPGKGDLEVDHQSIGDLGLAIAGRARSGKGRRGGG